MSSRVRVFGLYRHIVSTYRSKASTLLAIAAIVFVPLSLVEVWGDRLIDVDVDSISELEFAALFAAAVVESGALLLGEVFYSGAVAAVVVAARAGRSRSWGDIVRELPWRPLLVVDVLFNLGLALGLLLFILPGIVFFTYFALAAPVVEIERRGVGAAFRRSARLVRGRFWAVLAVLLPVAVAVDLVAELGGLLVEDVLGDSLAADWLGTAVPDIVTTPVYAVAAVVLTIDLIDAQRTQEPNSASAD